MWTSFSYDWSMMFKATTNQSSVTLLHTIDRRNRCAETPESLHVPVPFFSASSVGNREKRFGVKDALF